LSEILNSTSRQLGVYDYAICTSIMTSALIMKG